MLTLKQVNKAIRELGGEEELVKGEGYYYFINGEADLWESVYVCRLNELTLHGWIEDWESRAEPLETCKSFKAPDHKKDFYVECKSKSGEVHFLYREPLHKAVSWTNQPALATRFTQEDHVEDFFELFPELKIGMRHLKFY